MPLKKVIREVGYRSVSTFCRKFKEFYGATPSQIRYKNQLKNGIKLVLFLTVVFTSYCTPPEPEQIPCRTCEEKEKPLAAPSKISTAAISSSEIKVSWQDNSDNEDGFDVWRCRMPLCQMKSVAGTVGVNVTEFTDTDLSGGTEYCYQVDSYNNWGKISPSTESCAATLTDSRVVGALQWLYITGGKIDSSSPAIADVNNDGKNEVIIGSSDGRMYVLNGEDGRVVWSFNTGSSSVSSPAIADVNMDGYQDVLLFSSLHNLYCLSGNSGSLLWALTFSDSVSMGSPVMSDVDGDGKLEIIAAILSGWVIAVNGEDGSTLWESQVNYQHLYIPALADVNGDGIVDIVIGSFGRYLDSDDGALVVLNGLDGAVLWQRTFSDNLTGDPVVGDIDNDGRKEVVAGVLGTGFYAFEGENGATLWTYPIDRPLLPVFSVIGDVNSDNKLDVVVTSGSPWATRIEALNGENGGRLWSFLKGPGMPALGDVDGDGRIEVVAGTMERLTVLNGENGTQLWSFVTSLHIISSPALGDINNDGLLEVVAGSWDTGVYALKTGSPVPASSLLPWPKFNKNLWNTGSW